MRQNRLNNSRNNDDSRCELLAFWPALFRFHQLTVNWNVGSAKKPRNYSKAFSKNVKTQAGVVQCLLFNEILRFAYLTLPPACLSFKSSQKEQNKWERERRASKTIIGGLSSDEQTLWCPSHFVSNSERPQSPASTLSTLWNSIEKCRFQQYIIDEAFPSPDVATVNNSSRSASQFVRNVSYKFNLNSWKANRERKNHKMFHFSNENSFRQFYDPGSSSSHLWRPSRWLIWQFFMLYTFLFSRPPPGISSTLKRGPCLVEQTKNKSFIATLILSTTKFIALSCYHLSHSAFRLMALGCCMKITS